MKIFKRGGFIILDDSTTEVPIPVVNFDYQILGDRVKIRDVGEQLGYSSSVSGVQDELGTPVGDATAISAYFAGLTAGGAGSDTTAANQVLNINEIQGFRSEQDAYMLQNNLELSDVKTELTDVNTELDSIKSNTDNLIDIKSGIVSMDTKLDTIIINTNDLADIKTELESIDTKSDNLALIKSNTDKTDFEKLISSDDLVMTYTTANPGTVDQRVTGIAYSSTSLGLSITETFTYSATNNIYYITAITKS